MRDGTARDPASHQQRSFVTFVKTRTFLSRSVYGGREMMKRIVAAMGLLMLLSTYADAGQYELSLINSARAKRGLHAYTLDPDLEAVAKARAQRMAANSYKGHVSGSYSPGRAEGVAWHSSSRSAVTRCCYALSGRFRRAGSASVRGRDGYYFATVYR